MKFIMEGAAKQCPTAIALLNEELLLNPALANEKLKPLKLEIDRIEMVNGEKVVYIKESNDNILLG